MTRDGVVQWDTGAKGNLKHRETIENAERGRLGAACDKAQSSLYFTGYFPGWRTEIMLLVLSIVQRRFDCLTNTDFSDLSAVEFSAKMMFEHINCGADRDWLDIAEPIGTGVSTPPTLGATAQALGLCVTRINVQREFTRTKNRVRLSIGIAEPGIAGAIRMQAEALHDDKVVLRRRSIWYVTKDIDQNSDLREGGFHYRLERDVPVDVPVKLDMPLKDRPAIGGRITTNPLINTIRYVCEAVPGIRRNNNLPLLLPIVARW